MTFILKIYINFTKWKLEMKSNKTHIFFWGGTFSNWHKAKFVYKNQTFENSEQAFMWEKALTFKDYIIADKILKTPNPKENKKLGRKVKNFNNDTWMEIAPKIMYEVNYCKFTQNPKLLKELLSTNGKDLVEASPYDKIWGIGLSENEAVNLTPNDWKGKNWLGKVLTDLRNNLL
jgi:ribA/ribD-fused uncharacterized protein